jgi:hypothetical protein
MIAKLLSHAFRASPAAKRAHGRSDRLPDLPGGGFLRALQRRHEQGVGTDGADAEIVIRWPHLGLLHSYHLDYITGVRHFRFADRTVPARRAHAC